MALPAPAVPRCKLGTPLRRAFLNPGPPSQSTKGLMKRQNGVQKDNMSCYRTNNSLI